MKSASTRPVGRTHSQAALRSDVPVWYLRRNPRVIFGSASWLDAGYAQQASVQGVSFGHLTPALETDRLSPTCRV